MLPKQCVSVVFIPDSLLSTLQWMLFIQPRALCCRDLPSRGFEYGNEHTYLRCASVMMLLIMLLLSVACDEAVA